MKKINKYIIEKLKLSKDLKAEPETLYKYHDGADYKAGEVCALVYSYVPITARMDPCTYIKIVKIKAKFDNAKFIKYSYKNFHNDELHGDFYYTEKSKLNYIFNKHYKEGQFDKAFLLPNKESIELLQHIIENKAKMDYEKIFFNESGEMIPVLADTNNIEAIPASKEQLKEKLRKLEANEL